MKAYIFIAEGFEEIEALTVADILRRAETDVCLVSMGDHLHVMGSHQIRITCDSLFCTVEKEIRENPAGVLLVLPGGMPGTKHLSENDLLKQLLIHSCEKGARLAAVCAAPRVLYEAGLIHGQTVCCHPSVESILKGCVFSKEKVRTNGRITTSRGMGTAIAFALELASLLAGEERARQIADSICY